MLNEEDNNKKHIMGLLQKGETEVVLVHSIFEETKKMLKVW